MPIIIAGTIDVAPEKLEACAEAAKSLMEPTRAQKGCLDYVFTADPIVPGRLTVYERWEDEASLKAHFDGPNYRNMRDLIAQYDLRGALVHKFRISLVEPVYDPQGVPRADFFTEEA